MFSCHFYCGIGSIFGNDTKEKKDFLYIFVSDFYVYPQLCDCNYHRALAYNAEKARTYNDLISLMIYVCFIVFGIYLFIIATKAKQVYKENGYCKNVASFAATVGAVAIGLSFNYLYLQRFMYLVSFALLMIIPLHNKGKEDVKSENIIILPASLFLLFFNDIYIFIVNYVGSYFLSF